jgi:hypothetical protein
MQEATPWTRARKASFAGLLILLAVQGLVLLFTIMVVLFGGPPAILLGGIGGAAVLLLILFVQQLSGTRKPVVAIWAVTVPVIDVLAFVMAFGPLGGTTACSTADEAVLRSIDAPAGVVFQGEPGNDRGICGQAFVASIPLTDVLDSYRATLESEGWTVLSGEPQAGVAEGNAPAQSDELVA